MKLLRFVAIVLVAFPLTACSAGTDRQAAPLEPSPFAPVSGHAVDVPEASPSPLDPSEPGVSGTALSVPSAEGSSAATPGSLGATSAVDTSATTAPAADPLRDGLDAGGWLTPDGHVLLRTDAGAEADAELVRDLCAYLFGTPEEVAGRAMISAPLDLIPASGVHVSATGGFVTCGYAVADRIQLALSVGHTDDDWANGITTLVDQGRLRGVISYVPDFAGPTIAEADAKAWLGDVLARVDPAA